MSNLEALLERYICTGVDPLSEWSTEDLADLETLVNAELQERARSSRYIPGCECFQCQQINAAEGRE